MIRHPSQQAKSDNELLHLAIEHANEITEADAKDSLKGSLKDSLFRLTVLVMQRTVYEIQCRLTEGGLSGHPLFKTMATELAKLTDEQADDMFEISKIIKDLTPPTEVKKIFASVVGREVGASAPPNPYKKALGL